MSNRPPPCTECKHCHGILINRCHRFAEPVESYSIVTGETDRWIGGIADCRDQRGWKGKCHYEGRYFEQAPTFWQSVKALFTPKAPRND